MERIVNSNGRNIASKEEEHGLKKKKKLISEMVNEWNYEKGKGDRTGPRRVKSVSKMGSS